MKQIKFASFVEDLPEFKELQEIKRRSVRMGLIEKKIAEERSKQIISNLMSIGYSSYDIMKALG